MRFYEICSNLLKQIITKKQTLSYALRSSGTKIKNEERKNIVSLVGSFLRNYEFIKYISKEIFNTCDQDLVINIGVAYIDGAIKKFNDIDVSIGFIKEKFVSNGLIINDDCINNFKIAIEKKRNYELKNVKIGSINYFSIRYNIPNWIVKMLLNQYGKELLISNIKAMSKMPNQYALKYKFYEEINEISKDLTKFEKVYDDFYKFIPETSIKKEELVRNYCLIPMQLGTYKLLKYLPAFNNKEITIYLGNRSSDFFLILNKYGGNNLINLLQKNEKDNFESFAKIKKTISNNITFNSSDIDGTEAYLSKKQDAIFYYPKSSSLDSLRREPEYGITFETNILDNIIKDQEDGLKHLSKLVNKDGYFVYMVNTINIKETILMIKKFLSSNLEYKLDIEQIFFPADIDNSLYYFAILRKIK